MEGVPLQALSGHGSQRVPTLQRWTRGYSSRVALQKGWLTSAGSPQEGCAAQEQARGAQRGPRLGGEHRAQSSSARSLTLSPAAVVPLDPAPAHLGPRGFLVAHFLQGCLCEQEALTTHNGVWTQRHAARTRPRSGQTQHALTSYWLLLLLFRDRVSLYCPGWPLTPGLKPPEMLELQSGPLHLALTYSL